jgi:hypothetical protein
MIDVLCRAIAGSVAADTVSDDAANILELLAFEERRGAMVGKSAGGARMPSTPYNEERRGVTAGLVGVPTDASNIGGSLGVLDDVAVAGGGGGYFGGAV